jgi:hypothetical protein
METRKCVLCGHYLIVALHDKCPECGYSFHSELSSEISELVACIHPISARKFAGPSKGWCSLCGCIGDGAEWQMPSLWDSNLR